MAKLVTKVYQNASVTGPFLHTTQNRMYVRVVLHGRNRRVLMTLARFIMQEHVGRELESCEEVDHIDEDKTNDVLDNLQILTQKENSQKSNTVYTDSVKVNCFFCEKEFLLTPKQQRLRNMNRNRVSTGPFCSRSCVSKFLVTQR